MKAWQEANYTAAEWESESWLNQAKVIAGFIVSGMRQAYDMEKITGKPDTKQGGNHDLGSYQEMISKKMGIG